MPYQPRCYRDQMGGRFAPLTVTHLETDLWIGVPQRSDLIAIKAAALQEMRRLRSILDRYIEGDPQFHRSMIPLEINEGMPGVVKTMVLASQSSHTGPMATVAGFFAESVGQYLLERFQLDEIVVENGGDLFLKINQPVSIPIFAGSSPLSGRVGFEIFPEETPCGVCTSAGTVGPSISFGKADGVMVAAQSTLIADGWATAVGNRVHQPEDIDGVLGCYDDIPGVLGVIIICGDRIGLKGRQLKMFKGLF